MKDELACLNCEAGPFNDAENCPNCGAYYALVWADEYKRDSDGSLVYAESEQ